MTDTTIIPAPATANAADISGPDAAQKRLKNLSHRDFGTSAARQAAAIAWAGAEVGAELRDNTAALNTVNAALATIAGAATRQAEAAERAAAAAERNARFAQVQTMLAFYNTPTQMLPDGVAEQFKEQLGITSAPRRPVAAPVAPASTAPAVASSQHDEFS